MKCTAQERQLCHRLLCNCLPSLRFLSIYCCPDHMSHYGRYFNVALFKATEWNEEVQEPLLCHMRIVESPLL